MTHAIWIPDAMDHHAVAKGETIQPYPQRPSTQRVKKSPTTPLTTDPPHKTNSPEDPAHTAPAPHTPPPIMTLAPQPKRKLDQLTVKWGVQALPRQPGNKRHRNAYTTIAASIFNRPMASGIIQRTIQRYIKEHPRAAEEARKREPKRAQPTGSDTLNTELAQRETPSPVMQTLIQKTFPDTNIRFFSRLETQALTQGEQSEAFKDWIWTRDPHIASLPTVNLF